MELADYIVNLVGMLLWLSWRGLTAPSGDRPASLSLAGTLRPTNTRDRRGVSLLVLLGLLLLGRAAVYRLLAPAAGWTPKLDLRYVVPAFPNEDFVAMVTYSLLSFLRLLSVLYFWMLALNIINRRSGEHHRMHKLIRQHLGLVGRWPWYIQLVLPLALIAGFWIALAPLLALLGVTSHIPRLAPLCEQGLLIGGTLYLSLKYPLPAILLAHLIINYVYFGRSAICDFINLTATKLLAPIRRLPLKVGRVDFAPVVGAALILLLLQIVPTHVIPFAERSWHVRLHPLWPL